MNHNTRINSVFCVLTTVNLLLPFPVHLEINLLFEMAFGQGMKGYNKTFFLHLIIYLYCPTHKRATYESEAAPPLKDILSKTTVTPDQSAPPADGLEETPQGQETQIHHDHTPHPDLRDREQSASSSVTARALPSWKLLASI